MTNKYQHIRVNGYWKDDKSPIIDRIVTPDVWDGYEDEEDEDIFYYLEGSPILGDHGDFVLTEIIEE